MNVTGIKKAWDECELTYLEELNTHRIDPAVFEPQIEDFVFDDNPRNCDLWEAFREMENVSFMSGPLDGYLREQVYVWLDDESGKLSIRTYSTRIKISPANDECSFEVFKIFLQEFEEKVCELEFLGGLEEMDMD